MTASAARFRRILSVGVLAAVTSASGPVADARAAGEPCNVATMLLRVTSTPADLLWSVDFDVDPAPAGSTFLKSNAVLDCQYLQSGCSGCTSGHSTLNDGTGVASFSAVGAFGFDPIYLPDPIFLCRVATNGTLPQPSDFSITVTSATGSSFSLFDPPAPTTATVVVDSLTCGASCDARPRDGCLTAGASSLLVDPFHSGKLLWKWTKGDALDPADISDPTTSGQYTVCMYPYAADGDYLSKFIEEQRLPVTTGWKAMGTRGYQYHDDAQSLGPVRRLKVKTGKAGHTSLWLRSDNPREDFLPAAAVTMQLIDPKKDLCWESVYSGYTPDPNRFEGTTGN